MALTFDVVGPSSAGAGGANPASPLTWTHVCASGAGGVLFVGIGIGDKLGNTQFVVTGVTYNGVALTEITHRHANDQTNGYATLWYLEAPATGSNTVSVAFTRSNPNASDAIEAGSTSFIGASSPPYRNATSAVGYSTAPSVNVTSATGNIVLDVMCCGAAYSATGKTIRWSKNVNTQSAGGNAAQSTAAGAASVTMSYTTGNDWWAIVGVDVVAAAAGGLSIPVAMASYRRRRV